jgi:phage tail sheath gpL-like
MAIATSLTDVVGGSLAYATANPEHRPGQRSSGENGAEFVYARAAAATTRGQLVHLSDAFLGTLVTTASSPFNRPVGVFHTTLATNEWGWCQIGGQAPLDVAAGCVLNVRLNTTAVAGRVDDDATTGAKVIEGVTIIATTTPAAVVEATFNGARIGVTL